MLPERLATILHGLVDEYIRSGEPVASKMIVDKYMESVSPATVRNDLAALEEMGYVHQPHTSAGRVPTELGYRYYIDHFLRVERAGKIAESLKRSVNDADSPSAMLRAAARALVDMSGNAAFVSSDALGPHYAGLANLMRGSEFDDAQRREQVAHALDHAEGALAELLRLVTKEEVTVWLGSDNPLGAELASIVVRVRLPNGEIGMLGLMGPLRMRYGRNIGLLQQMKKMIDDSNDDL